MMQIRFYTKENCSLCDDAYDLLTLFEHDYEFTVEVRDIYTNDSWLEEYQLLIPVIQIDDTLLTCEQSLQYDEIERALEAHCTKK